jgi:hypothetical protein
MATLNVVIGCDITYELNNLIQNTSSGVIEIPAGNFTVSASIDVRNKSNLTIRGAGMGATKIIATSALNGSDHVTHNSVFNANNLTLAHPNYCNNVTISDMTIDCSAQNASGVPVGAVSGYNLCAVEFQNVHNAKAERVEVIGAYGNGIVMGSIDPLYSRCINNPIIEDCTFDNVCRGILPTYGIAGSVMQVGAARGGRLNENEITNAGAPWMDAFNCFGTKFNDNYIEGINNAPIGAGQNKGIFHSDFGLDSCEINGNVSKNAGGFVIYGNMTPVFFNGQLPTHGAQNCTIENNRVLGHGTLQIAAPAIPASNVTITAPNYPIMGIMFGASSVFVNGVQQRLSGGNRNTFAAPANATIRLVYTSTPNWIWYYAPNVFMEHYRLLGGSSATLLGQAKNNQLHKNFSIEAPNGGFVQWDGVGNGYHYNTVFNCGHATGIGNAFAGYNSASGAAGTGSKNNNYSNSIITDTHEISMLMSNYRDDGLANTGNQFVDARLGTTMSGAPYQNIAATTFRNNI